MRGAVLATRSPETPPSSFDLQAKALWKLTLSQLKAQGSWATSDVPLLTRYVTSLEVARQARARIAASAKLTGDQAYVTEGSQGQLVQHPDLRSAREAERDASTYAAELLLSPKARAQHGVKLPTDGTGRLAAVLSLAR